MLPSVLKRHLITRLMVALTTDKLSINQLIAWSVWLQQLKSMWNSGLFSITYCDDDRGTPVRLLFKAFWIHLL